MMQVMPSMPMQQAAAVQGGEESDGEPDPTPQCKAVKIDQQRYGAATWWTAKYLDPLTTQSP